MMKKVFLFAVLMMSVMGVRAEFVSSDAARDKAMRFVAEKMERYRGRQVPGMMMVTSARQKARSEQGKQPAYYIFNLDDESGFVIVSAESTTLEILAYSDRGAFHAEDIDKGAEVFLEQYERDVETARTKGLTARQKAYAAGTTGVTGTVLLETASMNQWDGFWAEKYTPLKSGDDYAPAGCTATAAAILMRYHQWPAQGKGSHSYTSSTHGLKLSRDFSKDTYNWAAIPMDPCHEGTWSNTAKEEAPKALLACGIACDMDYDYDGSGASTGSMAKAMVRYFSYSVGYTYYGYYGVENPDLTAGFDASRKSLDNGRPVLVAGNGERGGHAFVMDGYNSQYYHYNLGWGGSNSGWWANGSISYDNYSLYEFYTDICPQTGATLQSGTSGTITWTYKDDGVLTISGTGEVPSYMLNGVLEYNVEEVVIEEGITSLANDALTDLRFAKITIPASLTSIGQNGMGNAFYLREVVVAKGNKVYASPRGVELYNKETQTLVFYSSYESEIHFPEGIKAIGDNACIFNYDVTSIDIPEGVTTIGQNAFFYDTSLQQLTLPSTLISIGWYAFGGTALTKVVSKTMYPCSPDRAIFYDCEKQSEGTLYVPYDAVDRYRSARSWGDWGQIKAIAGSETWENPYKATVKLTEAGTLAAAIKVDPYTLRGLVIEGPINGTDIKLLRQLTDISLEPHMLTSIDMKKARIVAGGESYDGYNYVTEDDVIPESMFSGCYLESWSIPLTTKKVKGFMLPYNLPALELPEGLERIEDYAFWNRDLLSLHIPASVNYIGKEMATASWDLLTMDVAAGNKQYKSVDNVVYTIDGKTVVTAARIKDETLTLPEGVEEIGQRVFYGGNFKHLSLPSTLTTMEFQSFVYLQNLEDVTCSAKEPPTASDAFSSDNVGEATLYVPGGSVEKYAQAEMWQEFGQIKAMATVKGDANGDGKVTMSDANLVVNYYVNGSTETPLNTDSADMNSDGNITMGDANMIVNVYVGE